jgi:hypothetical protein
MLTRFFSRLEFLKRVLAQSDDIEKQVCLSHFHHYASWGRFRRAGAAFIREFYHNEQGFTPDDILGNIDILAPNPDASNPIWMSFYRSEVSPLGSSVQLQGSHEVSSLTNVPSESTSGVVAPAPAPASNQGANSPVFCDGCIIT